MDHDTLEKLKQTHTTLRLLNADHMPLIVSFLRKAFILPGKRSLPFSDARSLLEDYLFHLREIRGADIYPRSARDYLEDWAAGETAFLRKYYTDFDDEPQVDVTPAAEKAVEWLESLKAQQFIGTESRLLAIFELLRDIVLRTEADPEARIAALQQRRDEIDQEIQRIRVHGVPPHDPTQVKERYYHLEDTARKLLADFRQVEHNFRTLDRETRERIARSDKAKGELLDQIFHDQDVIRDSDQGKSFRAFWEFLMSRASQEELRDLLKRTLTLPEVREIRPDRFLEEIPRYLLDAGEQVYQTANQLVEQLRKYLDDQAYLENRRIMALIRGIEKTAVDLTDSPPAERDFIQLDDLKPDFDFTMDTPLFSPPKTPVIQVSELKTGEGAVDLDALYRQKHIDMTLLRRNIRRALETKSQVTLSQLLESCPIENGLAELLAYLHLASQDDRAMIQETETEVVQLTTEAGVLRRVEMPRVIFVR